jgi:hypothetical protein
MLKLQALLSLSFLVACSPATPPPQEPVTPAPTTTVEPPPAMGGTSATGGAGAPGSAGAAPTEKMCGGIAGIQCPANQYCMFAPEAHCGAADMSGTCAPKPEMCTQQMDEVCGCDDKTYGNACMAAQAGVSVVMKGACAKPPSAPTAPEGKLCGTRGAPQECDPGLYCAFKSACGATDAGGLCTKKPEMCTKIYMPVCGCDGKTYGSACTAAAAGVSVAEKGECKKK